MQSFIHLHLPVTLDTSQHDITREFFLPLLSHAVRYDRGVGYFSSGWLRINAVGMAVFAEHGGSARWITSPILSREDWQAMLNGSEARQNDILRRTLERNITQLQHDIEAQTLSALAWMVADNILDFRLAVPVNDLTGEFHTKFGIFTDKDGNSVSFEGSYNDSVQGISNYESLKIFRSWEAYQMSIVEHDRERFERLWCNQDPNVQVYDLPDAARHHILQLRTQERPYALPKQSMERASIDISLSQPHIPVDVQLREYQEAALQAWFQQACQGILEMATGTGKTITALSASARLFEREQQLAIIITCPYQHLVDQWYNEARRFGLEPLLAYQTKRNWIQKYNQWVSEYNHGDRSHFTIITTHTTFTDTDFQRITQRLDRSALLIADEVHHLGAEQSRTRLPANIPYRLGLSATPDRWFDDTGTALLRKYFAETAFAFSLAQAIGVVLTPYRYYPHLVELTADEVSQYQNLTEKIGKLIHSDNADAQEALEMLLIKRARLLNNAENKLFYLNTLLSQLGPLHHTLFYCAPEQIDAVCQMLGWDHGMLIHRFTAEEPNDERRQLLTDFDKGQLQGLVAMKCLDEGIDVPSTRIAFILASSSNPREFIQRRGRILRAFPGKTEAIIYDLIAIPPQTRYRSASFHAERSIIKHEIHRFREFANSARNKHQALDVIWHIARRYDIDMNEV
ncbi:MAG: DEAD/DEAH box helicase family protein [Chloroflexaceae bacterium]|nr:DEAD/DEAH box helicase family protein [Chloroflexaceae bacterium]